MLTTVRRPVKRMDEPANDAGITLTELVVSMGMSTLLGTVALLWFVGANRASHDTSLASSATSSARGVLQSWTQLLQLADSPSATGTPTQRVEAISPTSITFNTNLANRSATCTAGCTSRAATRVMLALTPSGQLTQSLTPTTSGTSSRATVVVPSGVTASSCLFDAIDTFGNDLGCATSLSSYARATIAQITVTFTVTPPAGRAQAYSSSATITGSLP